MTCVKIAKLVKLQWSSSQHLKYMIRAMTELMITRMSNQPAFDGAMPYILRGGLGGGEEADPEKQLKSSIPHNILQYLETLEP